MYNALEQRLDAFVRGESGETALIDELCAICVDTPDVAWEVLAVTDQYYRRGKISADLSRTIRNAIERPALARQVAGCAEVKPVAEKPVPPTQSSASVAAPGVAAHDDLYALRSELHASRRKLARYRARLAKVVAVGRRHRDNLAQVRRELKSPVNPRVPSAPPRTTAMHFPPPGNRNIPLTASKWVGPSQIAAAMVMLLTVTASSALLEPPIAPVAPPVAPTIEPAAAIATAPAIAETQHLSLGSERYIIRPGERQALIKVRRTGGTTGKVSFTWWTRASGAKAGADYQGQAKALEQIPEGADTLTLSVPIMANPQRKHTELFYVGIGHPSGGAAIGSISTSAVILMPEH